MPPCGYDVSNRWGYEDDIVVNHVPRVRLFQKFMVTIIA